MSARAEAGEQVGLCFTCRNGRVVTTPQATYWMCRHSLVDARYPKYPRLPVLECAAYSRSEEPGPEGPGQDVATT